MKTAEEWLPSLGDDPYCVPCGLAMIRQIQADALESAAKLLNYPEPSRLSPLYAFIREVQADALEEAARHAEESAKTWRAEDVRESFEALAHHIRSLKP